jgi:hypothetical protein
MPDYPALSTQAIGRDQLIARISESRKVNGATVEAAITELIAAGLVATTDGPVALTCNGWATHDSIRDGIEEITARLFDFPDEDLATAGRVLAIVTARADGPLADDHATAATA